MKNGDDPIKALARNSNHLVRKEKNLSHARVAQHADDLSTRTVGNIINGEFATGVGKVAAFAEAVGVPMWQLFLARMPETADQRAHLEHLVRAFLVLSPDGRKDLAHQARLVCRAEGKLGELEGEAHQNQLDKEQRAS